MNLLFLSSRFLTPIECILVFYMCPIVRNSVKISFDAKNTLFPKIFNGRAAWLKKERKEFCLLCQKNVITVNKSLQVKFKMLFYVTNIYITSNKSSNIIFVRLCMLEFQKFHFYCSYTPQHFKLFSKITGNAWLFFLFPFVLKGSSN